MRIFVTGGSGYLGKELVKYLSLTADVFAPNNTFCNILDENRLNKIISVVKPDYIIHLAAFVDTFGCENDIKKALNINVIGTTNITKSCLHLNCKLIYISSEYVFSGNKGNYTTDDRLDPINVMVKLKQHLNILYLPIQTIKL